MSLWPGTHLCGLFCLRLKLSLFGLIYWPRALRVSRDDENRNRRVRARSFCRCDMRGAGFTLEPKFGCVLCAQQRRPCKTLGSFTCSWKFIQLPGISLHVWKQIAKWSFFALLQTEVRSWHKQYFPVMDSQVKGRKWRRGWWCQQRHSAHQPPNTWTQLVRSWIAGRPPSWVDLRLMSLRNQSLDRWSGLLCDRTVLYRIHDQNRTTSAPRSKGRLWYQLVWVHCGTHDNRMPWVGECHFVHVIALVSPAISLFFIDFSFIHFLIDRV